MSISLPHLSESTIVYIVCHSNYQISHSPIDTDLFSKYGGSSQPCSFVSTPPPWIRTAERKLKIVGHRPHSIRDPGIWIWLLAIWKLSRAVWWEKSNFKMKLGLFIFLNGSQNVYFYLIWGFCFCIWMEERSFTTGSTPPISLL